MLLDQTGDDENVYLYTGEQYDTSLGQYYLRARYYDPDTGRFPQMDTYQGRMNEPATLHKYLYANGDPVNGVDPSGLYTQSFGYAVEEEVERQYLASHNCGFCEFGSRQYFNPSRYLKPDIMNWDQKTLNEIKPLSPGGIRSGVSRLYRYKTIFGVAPYNFIADIVWTPTPATIDGTRTYFVNIGGIIFYTDDRTLRNAVVSATIATIAVVAKNNARKTGTRLGVGAVLQAAITNGLKVNTAANRARLQGLTFGVGFGFGLL